MMNQLLRQRLSFAGPRVIRGSTSTKSPRRPGLLVHLAHYPEEAFLAVGGITRGFDGGGFEPTMVLGVAVRECKGADIAVENRKWIDPSGRLNVDNPGAAVITARITSPTIPTSGQSALPNRR